MEFEPVGRMPGLRHPSVLASPTRAVADVSSASDVLRVIGPRPNLRSPPQTQAAMAAAAASDLESKAKEAVVDDDFELAAELYAQAIEADPATNFALLCLLVVMHTNFVQQENHLFVTAGE